MIFFSNNVCELVKTYIPNPRLRSNRKDLQPQSMRTETYKRFYTNIIVTLCNQLPPALRVDQSFSIVVNELEVFYLKKLKNTFMCNNVCSKLGLSRSRRSATSREAEPCDGKMQISKAMLKELATT